MTEFSDLPPAPWLVEQQNSPTPQPPTSAQPASSSSPIQWDIAPAPWLTETPAQAGWIGNQERGYSDSNSPEMRALLAPSVTKTQQPPNPQEPSFLANTGTGLVRAVEGVGRLPRTFADLYTGLSGDRSGLAGVVQQNVPTAEEGTRNAFADISALTGRNIQPYEPQGLVGKIYQDTLANAPLAAVGPGGVPGLISRETANIGGTTFGDTAQKMFPDSPGLQFGASLVGGAIGGALPSALRATGSGISNVTGRLFGTQNSLDDQAAKRLLGASGVAKDELLDQIDRGAPTWEFPAGQLQPQPTTATVTQNPGLLSYTFNDMAAAQKGGDASYWENAKATNAAQRQAVARVTPDLEPQMTQAQTNLTAATGALPVGVSAQEAGSTFRQGLQDVYDQRLNTRRAIGANAFDALDQSPARISLQEAQDYATTQAAQQAGEVGAAYKAAENQFRSGTGITLDTAPFSNSVLKGLTDLANGYAPGSAAQRAVLDVKDKAEQAIFAQEPQVAQARQAYAAASRPLDVFDRSVTPGPIANAVETTRFGGYTLPNDAVVGQFLRSNGSADAIDRLTSVFPDVKAATTSLSDYIASQVQARAVRADGSVDLNALQAITKPYEVALNKLPFAGVKQQFATIKGAQQAIDGLSARQKILDNFTNGLGTKELDSQGNYMFSPAKFDTFVQKNQPAIVNAYGQDGADRINQINTQLQQIAQTAKSKVPGQSGTSQSLAGGATTNNVLNTILGGEVGEAGMEFLASMTGKVTSVLTSGSFGKLGGVLVANRMRAFTDKVEGVLRQALQDPNYAKSLLTKYNPKMPTPAGTRALNYVAGAILPGTGVDPIYKRAFDPVLNTAIGTGASTLNRSAQ